MGTLSFGGGTGSGADSGAFTVAAGTTLELGGTRTEACRGRRSAGKARSILRVRRRSYCGHESDQRRHLRGQRHTGIASSINVSTNNLTLDGTLEGPGKLTVTGPATVGNTGSDVLGSVWDVGYAG